MTTDFTYDVIIRNHPFNSYQADKLARDLLKRGSLRVFSENQGKKALHEVDLARQRSRVMIHLLSKYVTDGSLRQAEAESRPFREKDSQRRLIIIRLDGVTAPDRLKECLTFDWPADHDEYTWEQLVEACLPQSALASKPAGAAEDCPLKKMVSLGHSTVITAAAFSGDSNHIVTASNDHTVRIWDRASLQCLQVFQDGPGDHKWVRWDSDKHTIVTGSSDGKVKVWDILTRQVVYQGESRKEDTDTQPPKQTTDIVPRTETRQDLPASPNGKMSLQYGPEGTIQIWNTKTRKLIRELKDPEEKYPGPLSFLAWSPDSRFILVHGRYPTIRRIWEVSAQQFSSAILTNTFASTLDFKCVAWSPDSQYIFIGAEDGKGFLWGTEKGGEAAPLEGHQGPVTRTALSPDGQYLISGGMDVTIRLWTMPEGKAIGVHKKDHKGLIPALAWSADSSYTLSGSEGGNLILMDLVFTEALNRMRAAGHVTCLDWSPTGKRALYGTVNRIWVFDALMGSFGREFVGHGGPVTSVKWSPDGRQALSGSVDTTLRLWNISSGESIEMKGHTAEVNEVCWAPDGERAASAAADREIRIWEVATGQCKLIMEGHSSQVLTIAWSPDGRFLLSGSDDRTVRIWQADNGACLYQLKGHTAKIVTVAWNSHDQSVMATAANGVIRIWDVQRLASKSLPSALPAGQTLYANAKVLIVGDSGVGKTALAQRLVHDEFIHTTSTDGAWATHLKLSPATGSSGVDREVWLWDFAGQEDYRLVHQLFMEEAAVAVLLFDPQKRDSFDGLGQWVRDLKKAIHKPFTLLLAAGRVDCGGPRISNAAIEDFMQQHGIQHFYRTSALKRTGCEDLRTAIFEAIDWNAIPPISSPKLYHKLKQEILHLRDGKTVFIGLNDLEDRMHKALPKENFGRSEVGTVVKSLARPGIIWEMKFGDLILLKPEIINTYGAALVRKVRDRPDEMGYIDESDLLEGNLDYQTERLPEDEEKFILLALNETLIRHAWTLQEVIGNQRVIIFPSFFRRERPEQKQHRDTPYFFQFKGPANEIYATLVVRLSHTSTFTTDAAHFYHDSADFLTPAGGRLGLQLSHEAKGVTRLDVWFDKKVEQQETLLFLRYVYDHLSMAGAEIIDEGKTLEGFSSDKLLKLVDDLRNAANLALDELAKEGLMTAVVGGTTHLAGQLYKPEFLYDWGIDGRIQFRHANRIPSGKFIWLQLKAGNSFLRELEDGTEVFYIKKQRHVDLWMEHNDPVMLVIMTLDGVIRWMDVRDYLIKATENGKKTVTKIIFDGEPFDIKSILSWRDKFIAPEQ
jgi:small GTP-binding protein